MIETNEEICNKLKMSIHDYYMGHIRQKLNHLLGNGKENEISNQIMQFLNIQIDTGNTVITKDNIVRILNSVLIEGDADSHNIEFVQTNISYCLPDIADIKIEDEGAVYLTERIQTPFNGIEEKSYYLYISPEYYNNNIRKYRR